MSTPSNRHALAGTGAAQQRAVRAVPARSRPMGNVLLVLDDRTSSAAAMHRAAALAMATEAKLTLLVVLPSMSAQVGGWERARSLVTRLEQIVGDRGFRTALVTGPRGRVALHEAHALAPDLVVIPGECGGELACAFVDEIGVPVLLAREIIPDGQMVAASGMPELAEPVVSVAQTYADRLRRRLTVLHDAMPTTTAGVEALAGSLSRGFQDYVVATKRLQLRRDVGGDRVRGAGPEIRVSRSPDHADAILDVARRRLTDVVVIGHRPRGRWDRAFGRQTSEKVIRQTPRSVLVVPTGDAASPGR